MEEKEKLIKNIVYDLASRYLMYGDSLMYHLLVDVPVYYNDEIDIAATDGTAIYIGRNFWKYVDEVCKKNKLRLPTVVEAVVLHEVGHILGRDPEIQRELAKRLPSFNQMLYNVVADAFVNFYLSSAYDGALPSWKDCMKCLVGKNWTAFPRPLLYQIIEDMVERGDPRIEKCKDVCRFEESHGPPHDIRDCVPGKKGKIIKDGSENKVRGDVKSASERGIRSPIPPGEKSGRGVGEGPNSGVTITRIWEQTWARSIVDLLVSSIAEETMRTWARRSRVMPEYRPGRIWTASKSCVVAAIDTSASISDTTLDEFLSALAYVCMNEDIDLWLIFWSCGEPHVYNIKEYDEMFLLARRENSVKRGGTCPESAARGFKRILPDINTNSINLIVMTDGEFPEDECKYFAEIIKACEMSILVTVGVRTCEKLFDFVIDVSRGGM